MGHGRFGMCRWLILGGWLCAAVCGCSSSDSATLAPSADSTPSQRLSVLVTVEPVAWFVEQLGGDQVEVHVLIPAGKEPETYAPTPRELAKFAGTEVFFRVGLASEEPLLAKLQTIAPQLKIVDLRDRLSLKPDLHAHAHGHEHELEQAHEHEHELEQKQVHEVGVTDTAEIFDKAEKKSDNAEELDDVGELPRNNETENVVELPEHLQKIADSPKSKETDVSPSEISQEKNSGLDPHFWMSPKQVRRFLPQIAETLIELEESRFPVSKTAKNGEGIVENKTSIEKNRQELDQKLEALQNSIQNQLQSVDCKILLVFHPAYGYFCEEFGLKQLAIEMEGKSPKPKNLADLILLAKNHQINSIIVQPEFNPLSAQTIAESIGANIVVHSPLEKVYWDNLNHLMELIVQAGSKSKPLEEASPSL